MQPPPPPTKNPDPHFMKPILPVCLAICTVFTGCLPPPPPYRTVAPGNYYRRSVYPAEYPAPGYLRVDPRPRYAPGPIVRQGYPDAGAPYAGVRPGTPGFRQQNVGVRQVNPGIRQQTTGVRQQAPGVRQATPQQARPAAAAPAAAKPNPAAPRKGGKPGESPFAPQ